jgi:hypothetical protein
MATKRTRKTRDQRARVTEAAREHYRAALPLQARYYACIESERDCGRAIGGVHCTECQQYREHSQAMRAELRLKPWEADPLNDPAHELVQELHRAH